MISPRCSSSGSYGTLISPHERKVENAGSELLESSTIASSVRIAEYLSDLPSRGWLGKMVFDSIMEEKESSKRARNLGERCWSSLIAFDNLYMDLRYSMLSLSEPDPQLVERCEMYERCWQKCRKIVETSGSEIVLLNPAYLRSSYFDLKVFMRMVLVRSLENRALRHNWVRALNLLDSVVKSHAKIDPVPDPSTPGPT